ncbi:hypothetical protein [Escherichia fergusonii]|uniref:hypothetical protein n=1 Tax=Escherichia fergusonii TaxID=564 RepID=UPI0020CDF6CE|nr:hypothetical protein [Escherichia fergusonii]MCP9660861.1 hypothetical protein [Escherichia fergusonii]
MQLINIKKYYPENALSCVQYFIDESGQDYYKSADLFTRPYLIAVDKFNVICGFSEKLDFYPNELSIFETDNIPDGFNIASIMAKQWSWIDGQIVNISGKLQATKKNTSQLALEAFTLQCAVDAGTASDEQIKNLAVLKEGIANSVGDKEVGK